MSSPKFALKPGPRPADNQTAGQPYPGPVETVMKSLLVLALVACAVCAAGCAKKAQPPVVSVPLTERQRDSILARSALPGAQVVGRALDVSDKSADHAAAENAAADSLFR